MTDIDSSILNHQSNFEQRNQNPLPISDKDDFSDIDLNNDPFENLQLGSEEINQQIENIELQIQIKSSSNKNGSQNQNHYDNDEVIKRLKLKTPKKRRMEKKREQKKMKKKMKKLAKKQAQKQRKKQQQSTGGSRLKKSSGAKAQSDQSDYSNESNDSLSSSDDSVESMFANLNPQKRRKLNKKQRTQKKQGFSLKQLGDNAQIDYEKQKQCNSDESFESRKGKKKKNKKLKQKKEVTTNQDLLKKLLEIGLCVQEQQKIQGKEDLSERSYDDGIDALNQLKGSKKKGPKITNRLFSDMMVDQQQFGDAQAPPVDIKLEVKPRQPRELSSKASSFLDRTQKLKKIRGIESESNYNDKVYEQIISEKAKQSIVRIIKEKQLEDAEEIQLDVKVPVISRGRSSGEINNSMYFRKFGPRQELKKSFSDYPKNSPVKEYARQGTKISRRQLFNNLVNDVKERRSKDITHQLISKSFKITRLQEIEQTRKKNEQKRRRQALKDSDFEEEEDQNPKQKNDKVEKNLKEKQKQSQEKQNKEENQLMEQNAFQAKQFQINIPKQQEQLPRQIIDKNDVQEKIKAKKDPINQQKYRQLMRLEEGIDEEKNESIQSQHQQQQQQQQEQGQQDDEDKSEKNENQGEIQNEDQQLNCQEEEQDNSQIQDNSMEEQSRQQIDLQVQVDVQEDQHKGPAINRKFVIDSDDEQEDKSKIKEEQNKIHNQVEVENNPENFVEKEFEINVAKQKFNQNDLQSLDKLIPKQEKKSEEKMRSQFHKLRKLATVMKQKKIKENKMKIAGQMFQEEAQEGSDNEDHDQNVKQINREEEDLEYQGMDLDADLQEFLDNAAYVYESGNEENAFKKYMEDVKIQQRQELKRIMAGDFQRFRGEQTEKMVEMQEDDKERQKRMDEFQEYIKKREQQEGKDYFLDAENQEEQNHEKQDSEPQIVDEMNEQNLKRYLDDCLVDAPKIQTTLIKPKKIIPESYQRDKKLEKRNTLKSSKQIAIESNYSMMTYQKQGLRNQIPHKLKKTTSHLNQLIMKNKQKVKPTGILKTIMIKRK